MLAKGLRQADRLAVVLLAWEADESLGSVVSDGTLGSIPVMDCGDWGTYIFSKC
jgi:hypothetical protein